MIQCPGLWTQDPCDMMRCSRLVMTKIGQQGCVQSWIGCDIDRTDCDNVQNRQIQNPGSHNPHGSHESHEDNGSHESHGISCDTIGPHEALGPYGTHGSHVARHTEISNRSDIEPTNRMQLGSYIAHGI